MVVSVPTTLMAPAACDEMTWTSTPDIQTVDRVTQEDANSIRNSVAPGYLSSQKQVVLLVTVNEPDVKITSVELTPSTDGELRVGVYTQYSPTAPPLTEEVRYIV